MDDFLPTISEIENNFSNDSMNEVKNVTDYIYKTILNSVKCNKTSEMKGFLEELTNSIEKIENLLEISNADKEKYFYLGFISSISYMAVELGEEESFAKEFQNIVNHYPLLLTVLKSIDKHHTVSGVVLRDELNMKSSGLSNFCSRIEKYDLIRIQKYGNTNYYSLTSNGKKLVIEFNNCSNNISEKKNFSLTTLGTLLTAISNQLLRNNPNTVEVIFQSFDSTIPIREKDYIMKKIDEIIQARNKYIKRKRKIWELKLYRDNEIDLYTMKINERNISEEDFLIAEFNKY